ncbi:peptidoglycan DD-metalloendopeptidase family protein [Staphylococcus xylosus]|uniref:peptidoglycan DD-metalloendopeptidase family protein n=1 Tax=Staphylococcus xylosus TaxID=1288 RepID=UPI002DBEAFD3|nr:peptidoglycan DD-metalloendopeptidase family protein [Staphylococcus xylosus]MEB7801500.1 peptidoglycan DD-metalloendopeptidase family protein [Staphylococcus xylosus]
MAEDIRSMRIELSMRDMGVERTVGQIKQAFRTMKSEVSNATRMFDRAEKSTSDYWYQLKNLKTAQANYKNELKAATRQEAKMVEQHGQNSTQALKASEAVAQLKEQIDYTGRQIKTTTSEMEQFKVAQRVDRTPWAKMGKNIQGIGSQLGTISQKTGQVGMSLTKNITRPAGIAAAAVGGIALAKGWARLVEIDNAKAKLSALGNSGKQVETIMTNANTAVKGTSFGMGEAATTAANAVAAGIKPGKELTQYLTNTGDAAAIAGVGMDEMGRILNKVQTSNKAYNGELQELSDRGLPVYQWLAKEAGIAESEVADFAASGQVTSKMLQDAIENNIGGAAKKMGEKSFTASLANMWAALARVGAGFLDAGGKGGGFFSQMKPIMNNLTTMFDGMQGTAERWGVALGASLNAVLSAGVKVKQFYDGLPGPIQSVIKSTMLWGSLTLVAIGPMLLAFSKLTGALSMVFGPFGTFLTTIGKVAVASKNAGGIIAGITTLFPKLGAALTLATGPVGWIVAAIVGLGVAFVVAYKKSETFRNIVNGAFNGIVTGAKLLWSGIMSVLTPIGQAFIKFGGEIKSAIGDFWSKYGAQFVQAVTNIWNFIQPVLGFIGNLFKTVFGAIMIVIKPLINLLGIGLVNAFNIVKQSVIIAFGAVKGIIMGALNVVMGFVKMFIGVFTGDWKLFGEGIKQVIKSALSIIKNLFQLTFSGVLAVVKVLWGKIKSFIVWAAKAIWTGVKNNFTNLWNSVKTIFNTVKVYAIAIWTVLKRRVVNFAKNIWTGVKTNFTNLWNSIKTIFNTIKIYAIAIWTVLKRRVVNFAKSIWTGVKTNFTNLWNSIKNIFTTVKNWLVKTWTSIKNTVISRAKSLWTGVKTNFTNLWNSIRNIISKVRNWLINTWTTIKNKVVGLAKSLWNGVKDKFNGLKKSATDITQKLKNVVKDKWETLKKNVVNLATGAKDGVVKGFKAMYNKGVEWLDKLKGFIKGAKDGFKKVAISLGKGVANGAISGLNAMIDGINALSDKIMNKKLIKKKIPKLSTGTGASPSVQTDSQGRLKHSTKAVVNDKGIGNAKGPGGHKEIIQRRNGKMIQPKGRNKVVRLRRGDAVHNGMQSKSLRPHLSTGTNPAKDLLKKKKDKHKGDTDGSIQGLGGGAKDALDAVGGSIKDGAVGLKDWAVDKGQSVAKGVTDLGKAFGKKIGDVMDYVKNPIKLVNMTMKHFGVDFSKVNGEAMGGTMKWGYEGLKNGLKSLVTDWLTELEGGDGDASWLLKHPMLQEFGFYKGMTMNGTNRHWGLDFGMPVGTSVKAVTAGTITDASWSPYGGGNQVELKEPNGKWFQWWMHNSKLSVKKGDKVNVGDELAKSGNTGSSNAPHVHFQRMKGSPSNDTAVNPLEWLKSLGSSGGSGASFARSTIKKAQSILGGKFKGNYVLDNMMKLAKRESNYDSKAVNNWDSNAKAGTPSKGLFQMIEPTFKSWAKKGYSNFSNPVHQAVSAIRYINGKYGFGGFPRAAAYAYKTGGVINEAGTYNLAEDGHSEVVIPLDPSRASDAMKLITYAQSKVKDKKNKRPSQIGGISGDNDNTELLLQMIANQQKQLDALMQIAESNKNIEHKPTGFNERDVSRAQGKRARMMSYNLGSAF